MHTSRLLRQALRPALQTRLPARLPARFCLCQRFSQSALLQHSISDLPIEQYHAISDNTMESLTDYFEELIEDIGDDVRGSDVEYSSGVLTLRVGDDTYVVNKQPPNKQIWLSSPKSGPKRYDYDQSTKQWFYSRDDSTLKQLLDTELKELIHREIDVDVGNA